MSVRFYMDVHVRRSVTNGLRLRGVDVLTAQEDGGAGLDDPALLDRATSLERVLFTQDRIFSAKRRVANKRASISRALSMRIS